MDKGKIILISKEISSGYLKSEDMIEVIVDYCIEKGKDIYKSQQFAITLLKLGQIMGPFLIALEYFQKKFNICTITDEQGKVILTF